MRFSKAWVVAEKEFKIFRYKKSILLSILAFMILISIGMPLLIKFIMSRKFTINPVPKSVEISALEVLMDAFSIFFMIGGAIIPFSIATYSFVGEKTQKSLEPLLATPTTDGEILLGKSISAILPAIIITLIGGVIFMVLMDYITYPLFGFLYYPNSKFIFILLVLGPLASILCIAYDVLLSSRINDLRVAQQYGAVAFVPYIGIYLTMELGVLDMTMQTLYIIGAVNLGLDIILMYVALKTFQREEILTKWK